MNENKATVVRALAETISDAVFKRSLLEIAKSLELAAKYKRIDISFLQMCGPDKIPKFALLHYRDFKAGDKPCILSQSRGYLFQDGSCRFQELFGRGDYFNEVTALPKVMVPETVDAIVETAKEDFDELIVAWEADWQPRQGDPIVIGRKGTLYFIVATWDMTELESFVANTLAD